jgi:hypothetical protein
MVELKEVEVRKVMGVVWKGEWRSRSCCHDRLKLGVWTGQRKRGRSRMLGE